MITKDKLQEWTIEALEAHGGSASIVQICKHIWQQHKSELEASGDLFYTWQYDMRWAGDKLRKERVLEQKRLGDRGPWRLAK